MTISHCSAGGRTLGRYMIFDRIFKRDTIYQPHMPDVDLLSHPESVFTDARSVGLGRKRPPGASPHERYIALVTPGRHVMQLNCPLPGSRPLTVITDIRERFPVEPPGIVVAVALNAPLAIREIKGAKRAIPFLDYLLDLGYAGHAVTIFEGHKSAFIHAVKGSDLLIVDEGMMPFLQADWRDVARQVMRRPILEMRYRDGRAEITDLSAP